MVATKAGESGNQGVVTHAEPVLPQKPAAGPPLRPVRSNQMSCVVFILPYLYLTTSRNFEIQGVTGAYFIVNFYSFLRSNELYFSSRLTFKVFFIRIAFFLLFQSPWDSYLCGDFMDGMRQKTLKRAGISDGHTAWAWRRNLTRTNHIILDRIFNTKIMNGQQLLCKHSYLKMFPRKRKKQYVLSS